MQQALLAVAGLSLLGGVILRIMTRKHLTEFGQSVHWYDVKYWFAPWKAVDAFTRQGLRLHMTSVALIVLGALVYLIAGGYTILYTPR